MNLKDLKKQTLAFLAAEEPERALHLLQTELPAEHPSRRRVENLLRRSEELNGRIRQGTLREGEIRRIRAKIDGGVKDIAYEIEHQRDTAEEEGEKFVFRFRDLEGNNAALDGVSAPASEDPPPAPAAAPKGFVGEVDFVGSPSKKIGSLTVPKGYGATYHAATQALRKTGCTVEKGDREGGLIEAAAPGNSAARFGEIVRVYVAREERGRTEVTVIVDSANPDTLIDFGRHQQKLDAILHQLRNS